MRFGVFSIFVLQLFTASDHNAPTTHRKNKVRLVGWNAEACDNTYDPYRLVNRITNIKSEGGLTLITVNFSDNCCAEFKPRIQFKGNKLFLDPYKEYLGDYCSCDCCFSIEFKVEGIVGGKYDVYFKGRKIERSDDHYKVVPSMSVEHKGTVINRRNRYGFNEGMWMTFYENGNIKVIEQYPETEIYQEPQPIWTKEFYSSGKLLSFSREDTTESWFDDGQMEEQTINYKIGDTAYTQGFSMYANRQMQEKYLTRSYPIIWRSEFDPNYQAKGSKWETIYKEEYFENGQRKYLYGADSSYTWYASGKIASVEYDGGKIEYDENGFVTDRAFHWKTRGPSFWGDLNHSLYAEIGRDGKVLKVHYARDEATKDGVTPGIHYFWTWNNEGKLIKWPEEWNEVFPWERFGQLEINR